ncbi:hypothetical protein [Prauserella aidingensis]|uniref:hypothetical protein n=1 Tax=Prauserella aidingensis TaxID=387890 RepID=UPI0020A3049E|nr:hypothetical protein [Prauserella aidingensis]
MEDDVAKASERNNDRIDPEWPETEDGHPVSELAADRQGALSPFGDVSFPLGSVPYEHPQTEINKRS